MGTQAQTKSKKNHKPKWEPPRFAVITDRFPPGVAGTHDIQTGQRIPESKREYKRMVEKMGWIQT